MTDFRALVLDTGNVKEITASDALILEELKLLFSGSERLRMTFSAGQAIFYAPAGSDISWSTTGAYFITAGAVYLSADSVYSNASIPLLAVNNTADALDIGFSAKYNPTGSLELFCGLFRDATDGKFRLYHGSEDVPASGVVNTGATGYTVATLVANLEGNASTATTAAAASVASAVAGTGLTGTTLASNIVTSSLTAVGTITTGTWQGTVVDPAHGGTGVNNGTKSITLGGNLATSGAYNTTLTVTADTSVTLPTSGTLANRTNVYNAANVCRFLWVKEPSSSAAAATTRAGGSGIPEVYPVYAFDPSTAEYLYYGFQLPNNYNANGITFDLFWSCADANTAHAVVWTMAIRDANVMTSDYSAAGSFSQISSTELSPGTKIVKKSQFTFSGAAITALGLSAGDMFVLRLRRFANTTADDVTTDAWVWGLTAAETQA